MSLRLKQVTISGMNNVEFKTYDLSNFNYLHGRNGAGKSTVLKAIQLALLGYIPGINKTNSAIFEHCNGNKMFVSVQIERTESGSMFMIEREFVSDGGKITSSFRVVPDHLNIQDVIETYELPIFNFNQLRSMTANGIKDWFLSFLPPDESNFSWDAELREAVRQAGVHRPVTDAVFESIASQVENDSVTAIVNIRNANQFFKEKVSETKKRVQDIQGAISTLIYYPEVGSETTCEKVQAEIEYWTKMQKQAVLAENADRNRSDILSRIEALHLPAESEEEDASIVTYENNLKAAQDRQKSLQEEIQLITLQKAEKSSELSTLEIIIEGAGVCPYTSCKCKDIQSLMISQMKRAEDLRYDLEDIDHYISVKTSELASTKKSIDDCYAILHLQKEKYNELKMLKSRLDSIPDEKCEYSSSHCESKINELAFTLVKVANNESYQSNLERYTQEKFNIEMELELFKIWEKYTGPNALQAKVANQPFIRFAEMTTMFVSEFLPGSTFRFNLESKANSFSFGVERDGQYVAFDQLSAGEQCLVMISFFCSVLKTCHSSLPLLLVDDSLDHLDKENFCKVVDVLSSKSREFQAVFAGVQPIERSDEMENVKMIEL